jgi:hypothetical protein
VFIDIPRPFAILQKEGASLTTLKSSFAAPPLLLSSILDKIEIGFEYYEE